MRRIHRFSKLAIICLGLVLATTAPSYAAGDAEHPPEQEWSFDGYDGTFDRAALQRGLEVYRRACAQCHSLKRVAYRNLADLGYNEAQVKAIAAEYEVTDGPNDDGDMFERPALPSDRFVSPYKNNKQAEVANGGAIPPDLSLIVKARSGGADYLYALLTGYGEAPHDKELLQGQYWNKFMSGHVIAMPPPLSEGLVAYEDGTAETVDQYAKDVAEFLTWASDTKMEARKRVGVKALIFLVIFAIIMYAAKRRVWADVH